MVLLSGPCRSFLRVSRMFRTKFLFGWARWDKLLNLTMFRVRRPQVSLVWNGLNAETTHVVSRSSLKGSSPCPSLFFPPHHYAVQWILRRAHLIPKCVSSPTGSSFAGAEKKKITERRRKRSVHMYHSGLIQRSPYFKRELLSRSLDGSVEWRRVAARAQLIESPDWDGWRVSAALYHDLALWLSGPSHPVLIAVPSD